MAFLRFDKSLYSAEKSDMEWVEFTFYSQSVRHLTFSICQKTQINRPSAFLPNVLILYMSHGRFHAGRD